MTTGIDNPPWTDLGNGRHRSRSGSLVIDVPRSTVTLVEVGRTYPAATVICPGDGSDFQRSLGVAPHGRWHDSVIIPAENGALITIEESVRGHLGLLRLFVDSVCCAQSKGLWLPQTLAVSGGALIECRPKMSEPWGWERCESAWAAEHIDRLSTMATPDLTGPRARLVPLGYFATP